LVANSLQSLLPYKGNANFNTGPSNPQQQQNYFARNHKPRGLPTPEELAARIEEAKTSAKLLQQVVRSTPTEEVLDNELIKEFADRCQSASRSIQNYIHAENPSPDHETLLTLIETNEQLSNAMSKHQRALLTARKAANPGEGTTPPVELGAGASENPFADTSQPPPNLQAPLQPEVASKQPPVATAQQTTMPVSPQNHSQVPYYPGYSSEQGPPAPAPASHPAFANSTNPAPDQPVYYERQESAIAHGTMRGDASSEAGLEGSAAAAPPADNPEPVAYRY
jgi:hypothetical protein